MTFIPIIGEGAWPVSRTEHHRRTRLSRANIHSKPFVTRGFREVNVDVDRFQCAFIEDDKTRHFPVYFTKDGQLYRAKSTDVTSFSLKRAMLRLFN